MTWLAVWTRAVLAPAARRALATWLGCVIVAAVIFGPTGMQPHDLTGLALHRLGPALVLGLAWLLLFIPIARQVVRPGDDTGVSYLRALPSPHLARLALAAVALLILQLPWLALWLAGERAIGLAIVVGWTLVIAALAALQLPRLRTSPPRWRSSLTALFAIYRTAILRRASDAVVRGIAIAILTGTFAGLLVRNNAATGTFAALLAGSAISIGLIPACAGALLPLVDAQRRAAWLASSLGVSPGRQIIAMTLAIATLQLLACAVALAATLFIASSGIRTDCSIAALTTAMTATTTLITARSVVRATHRGATSAASANGTDAPRDLAMRSAAAAQVVVAMIGGTALAILGAAWLGVAGIGGALVIAFALLASTRLA